MNNKEIKKTLALFSLSLILALTIVEVVLHVIVEPSRTSSGRIFDRELPPFRIFPSDLKVPNEDEKQARLNLWHKPIIVNKMKITRGDLWGIRREHPIMGYVPKESAISKNGWWQTNSLGARSRSETPVIKPAETTRVLFFGDSFTQGSRIPQEDTYPNLLEQKGSGIQAVNFGVDGYGLGQSFLRYKAVNSSLEFDQVFLSFTPSLNLWRDVNTSRYIARRWNVHGIYPRFVINNGNLELVSSPYRSVEDFIAANQEFIQPSLYRHLSQYDRFFLPSGFEQHLILDHSILYKLFRNKRFKSEKALLFEKLLSPGSEATSVSTLIAKTMNQDVEDQFKKFTLLILPGVPIVEEYSKSPEFGDRWDAVVNQVCNEAISCLNLMPIFQEIGFENLDTGYDGSHFGAITNNYVATALLAYIRRLDTELL